MKRILCKSKIHRATVTQADLNYVGSVTIDQTLMKKANIIPYEQVHIVNINNGQRLITYAITGKEDSGIICLNGAAARLTSPGDLVIIMTYAEYEEHELKHFSPTVVFVDQKNKIKSLTHQETPCSTGTNQKATHEA